MRCPPPGRSTCKGQGSRVRGRLGRKWVSAFESSISPDGLELIGKVGAAGVGPGWAKDVGGRVGYGVWVGSRPLVLNSRMIVRTRRSRSRSSSRGRCARQGLQTVSQRREAFLGSGEGFEGQKYRRTTRSRWRLRSDVVMRDVPSYGTRCIRRTSKRTLRTRSDGGGR